MSAETTEYSRDLFVRQSRNAILRVQNDVIYLLNPFTLSYCRINEDMGCIWKSLERPQTIHQLFHRFELDEQFDSVIKELARRGFLALSQSRPASTDSDRITFSEASWTNLAVFPTHRCNLKCTYCYASGGDRHATIERDYIDEITTYFFDHCRDHEGNIAGLDFHGGGEPTIAFDLMKYAVERFTQQCQARGLTSRFGMATNGCFGGTVFSWLVKNGFDLTISFDGPPDIQNKQRPFRSGARSHDIVVQNIRRFIEEGVQIAVRSTITAESVSRICEVVKYVAELGVKFIHLEPCFEVGRCIDAGIKQPQLEVFLDEFLNAFRWSIRSGVHLKTAALRATEYPHNHFCGACGHNLAITPDGNVTTCYEVVTSDDPASEVFFVGRMCRNEAGKPEVYIDRDKLSILAKRTIDGMTNCAHCFSRYWCAGDCPVKAYRDTGSLHDVRPERCAFIRGLNESVIQMILDEAYFPTGQMSIVEYSGG